MDKRWVFDASPLIVLGKIGLLDLLEEVSVERVIPVAVADEVEAGRDTDPAKLWLRGGPAASVLPVPTLPVVMEWRLGSGESAAISFALQNPGFEAILDDHAGRTCARALGLRPRGTLGVLVLAKGQGAISKVRPHLDALLAAGYHLSPELIAIALEEAGEA